MVRRHRLTGATAAAVTAWALLPAIGGAQAIQDVPLPVPDAQVSSYSHDRPLAAWNGALWVASPSGDLMRVAPDRSVTRVSVPRHPDASSEEGPTTLSPSAEGLWMLSQAGRVALLLQPDGTFSGQRIDGFIGASSIAARPDGGMYVASSLGEYVKRVTRDGVREYPRDHGESPVIAAGPGGPAWFTEKGVLVRANDDGGLSRFPLPNDCTPSVGCALASITGLTLGPGNALWYTRSGLRSRATGPYSGTTVSSASVGRMTAAGRAREWDLPNHRIGPSSIVSGPDGNLWFVTNDGLGRVTPAGRVRLLKLPGGRRADTLAVGPDRALWFSDGRLNRVSRITPRAANALGGAEIQATALRRAGATVPVQLRCPAGGPACRGRVTLGSVPNRDAVFDRTTAYGAAPFVVRAGRAAVVRVRPNRALEQRLRRSRQLPVRVEIARGRVQGEVADLVLRR